MAGTGGSREATTTLERSQSLPTQARADVARDVLRHILGWGEHAVSAVTSADADLRLIEVAPSDRRLALLVVSSELAPARAVSLGYSSEALYTVSWSLSGLRLCESTRWDQRPGDVAVGPVAVGDRRALDLMDLLRPENLRDRLPSLLLEDGRQHQPLDEYLARSLARLRVSVAQQRAFDGPDFASADRALMHLFHQLLYVRSQEDRRQTASTYSIGEIATLDDPRPRLLETLSHYERQLDSELFDGDSATTVGQLPPRALSQLLTALVRPWSSLSLDFSVARPDLAGRLYESYLEQAPALESSQNSLFPIVSSKDQRRQRASFFTPATVARQLAVQTIQPWLTLNKPTDPSQIKIIDPACGSGTFLIAAYRILSDYFAALWGRPLEPIERREVLLSSIFGADQDPNAIDLARIHLLTEARLEGRLPSLAENLHLGDSLLAPPGTSAFDDAAVNWGAVLRSRGPFEIILANPPFGAQVTQPSRREEPNRRKLREAFPEVAEWGTDEAFLFLGLGLRLASSQSALGYVLPRTWLVGKSAQKSRAAVVGQVTRIADFRGMRLFPGAQSYVCLLVLGQSADILALDVRDSRSDVNMTLEALERPVDSESLSVPYRAARFPRHVLSREAKEGWAPFRLRWLSLMSAIRRHHTPFTSVSGRGERRVVQGTQPGDLVRFAIGRAPEDPSGDRIDVDGVSVPVRYAPLLVRGRNIRPFSYRTDGERLFVPFEDDKRPSGDPDVRRALVRLGGAPRNAQPGALDLLRRPKVLVRAFAREPAAAADLTGEVMVTKGTGGAIAIGLERSGSVPLQAVAGLLNSALYQWLLRGLGQPRNDETIEVLVRDFADLPWPHCTEAEWDELATLADEASETLASEGVERTHRYHAARESLDEGVFDLLRVDEKLRSIVRRELIREE